MMDRVQKLCDSEWYAPLSGTFRMVVSIEWYYKAGNIEHWLFILETCSLKTVHQVEIW